VRNSVILNCIYVAAYVTLDWISFIEALPGVGFTPWKPRPPPALHSLY
jgi:hypothetical protein